MLLEDECKNQKGLKEKTILRFTPNEEQPIKKKFSTQNVKPGENSAQNQVLLLENPFKTTVNTSLPPSEIFKAIDVSGSGNSKAIAKKLLEKTYPFSPRESSSSLPETYSFAKDSSFTKEEIKRVIQTLPKGKAPGFDGIDNQVAKF
ncbi:hypothetical protein CDAR_180511 [Caerostris darwini]|uniref:Reverse transcriptase n=1 Tax=Caerostris darwini TaxID=1538125 RepID=A0AAV4TNX0_9ARAC|nr:hypothetical protein CDAR_180511 [Caerostris darwini]